MTVFGDFFKYISRAYIFHITYFLIHIWEFPQIHQRRVYIGKKCQNTVSPLSPPEQLLLDLKCQDDDDDDDDDTDGDDKEDGNYINYLDSELQKAI